MACKLQKLVAIQITPAGKVLDSDLNRGKPLQKNYASNCKN